MDPRPGIVTEKAHEPLIHEVSDGSQPVGIAPATVLVVSVWIGLVAGFLDLGLMVMRRRLIDGGFYRLGEHFGWIIPFPGPSPVFVPGRWCVTGR